ncbi:MAG: twin-arginine translocation signal domain-containing protein [Planctomycetota bacterium]
MSEKQINRRQFIKRTVAAAGAAGFPYFVRQPHCDGLYWDGRSGYR